MAKRRNRLFDAMQQKADIFNTMRDEVDQASIEFEKLIEQYENDDKRPYRLYWVDEDFQRYWRDELQQPQSIPVQFAGPQWVMDWVRANLPGGITGFGFAMFPPVINVLSMGGDVATCVAVFAPE